MRRRSPHCCLTASNKQKRVPQAGTRIEILPPSIQSPGGLFSDYHAEKPVFIFVSGDAKTKFWSCFFKSLRVKGRALAATVCAANYCAECGTPHASDFGKKGAWEKPPFLKGQLSPFKIISAQRIHLYETIKSPISRSKGTALDFLGAICYNSTAQTVRLHHPVVKQN